MSQLRLTGEPPLPLKQRPPLTNSERQIYSVIKYQARSKEAILDLRRNTGVLQKVSPGTIDRGLRKLVEKGWARKIPQKRGAPKWEGLL